MNIFESEKYNQSCVIYVFKNKINGKCYVGQTTNFKKRFQMHKRNYEKSLIGNAIKKYGVDNFKILIFKIPVDKLDYFEIELIKRLDSICPNGYNLDSGGNKNKTHCIETRIKMSEASKGKSKTPEHRIKMSEASKGKSKTPEHRRKISEAKKGKKRKNFSSEHRRKMSEAAKLRRFRGHGKQPYQKGLFD